MLDGPGKVAGVPFVEAEPAGPWRWLTPLVGSVGAGRRLEPGTEQWLRVGDVNVAVVTCYEVLFSAIVEHRVRSPGARILYLADDSWGGPAVAAQALAAATFRAIENRATVVRVAGSGSSALIGPDGRRIQQLPFRRHGHLDATIRPSDSNRLLEGAILVGALVFGVDLGWRISNLTPGETHHACRSKSSLRPGARRSFPVPDGRPRSPQHAASRRVVLHLAREPGSHHPGREHDRSPIRPPRDPRRLLLDRARGRLDRRRPGPRRPGAPLFARLSGDGHRIARTARRRSRSRA